MKTRPWFQRLLSTYLPIFYLVIIFLIFVFFMATSQVLNREMSRTSENYAKYVMQTIESSLQNIDRLVIREINNNDDIQKFLFQQVHSDINEHILNSRLSEKFNNLIVNFPLIDSIYFYRAADGKILSSNAMLSLEDFGDREFVEQLRNGNIPYTWTGVRSFKLFAAEPQSYPVISLVKKVPLLSDPRGFVIVNVSTSAIQKLIDEMNTQNISYTAVYDRNGNPIAASDGNEDDELSHIRSDYAGWEIRTGLKKNYNYGVVSDFYYGWMVLGVLAILVGTIVIVYLAKRYTSPIDRMLNRITQYSKKELPDVMNDNPRFIETAVDHLIELANQYTDVHKENLLHRRKQFFIETVGGERSVDPALWEKEMRKFGMPGAFRKFYVGIVEIDKYAKFCEQYSYRDQCLLKFVVSSVVREIAAEFRVHAWSEWLEKERLTTLFQFEEDIADSDATIRTICDRTRLWMKDHLDYTVSIGVGTGVTAPSGIARSFDEAEEALAYKTAAGENRTIPYWEVERNIDKATFEYLQLICDIADSFKRRNGDWKIGILQLMDDFKSKFFLRQDIVNLLNYLIFHISKEIGELPLSYKDIWEGAAAGLNEVLEEFDTVDDLRDQFIALLSDAVEQMEKLRSGRNNQELIQKVKSYIEENSHNPDLSLGLLSEQFNINQSSLSRLFKDEFGENFVDYVARIRIERAKKLLQFTNVPIQEIAGQVGYLHHFSFNRVFKKIVGVTPGEFRRQSFTGSP